MPRQRVLVISGGSSGIGLATAQQAMAEFDYVYNLDMQAPQVQQDGLIYINCDVSDAQQVIMAIQKIHAEAGSITHLVSAAGILESNRLEQSTSARIQQVVNTNLLGTIYLLQAVLPILQQQHYGHIVLVGSDQSLIGKAGNAVYGCTKAAVAQLAKSMALENAAFGLRVNCVCPGTIDTPFYQRALRQYAAKHHIDIEQLKIDLAQEQPVGRIGTADEVAALILFLLSEQANYITGALIPIDGGYTAQ